MPLHTGKSDALTVVINYEHHHQFKHENVPNIRFISDDWQYENVKLSMLHSFWINFLRFFLDILYLQNLTFYIKILISLISRYLFFHNPYCLVQELDIFDFNYRYKDRSVFDRLSWSALTTLLNKSLFDP